MTLLSKKVNNLCFVPPVPICDTKLGQFIATNACGKIEAINKSMLEVGASLGSTWPNLWSILRPKLDPNWPPKPYQDGEQSIPKFNASACASLYKSVSVFHSMSFLQTNTFINI